MGNNNMVKGGGGIVLAAVGAYLLNSGTGPFILGLIVLIVGIGLVVHLLLSTTEADGKGDSGATGGAASGSGLAGLAGMFDFSGVRNLPAMNRWVAGALMGVLSMVGLFLYSRASDGMFGLFGALLFFFGLAVIIVFVHQATDYSHEHHSKSDEDSPSDQGPAAA